MTHLIKKMVLFTLVAAMGLSITAYSASSDDDDYWGFSDWRGLTDSTNQYFFDFDETITVFNKEVDISPDYRYIYSGSDIYVPIGVYPDGGRKYEHATAKMLKTDNVTVSSKAVNGAAYVGDIEVIDGKKLKLTGVEAGMYARIPISKDFSDGTKAVVTMRLVLSVNGVDYQDTRTTLRFRISNRTTEIDKNSIYGAKTPSEFKVKYNYIGEATFDFGDDIKYTVKVRSSASYYLNLSREPDPVIKEMYPDAFLDFYNFLGDRDTFTSTGSLNIPVKRSSLSKKGESESLYVYRVDGSTLTALGSGVVSYDAKTETLTIKTKKLQNYVLSNQALKKDVSETDDDILKSGYAAASNAEVSEIADTSGTDTTSSASTAASTAREDSDGYVPEEAEGYPTYNINDNVETGTYINADNKSSDNPSTSGPGMAPALAGMLAGGGAVLAALFGKPRKHRGNAIK